MGNACLNQGSAFQSRLDHLLEEGNATSSKLIHQGLKGQTRGIFVTMGKSIVPFYLKGEVVPRPKLHIDCKCEVALLGKCLKLPPVNKKIDGHGKVSTQSSDDHDGRFKAPFGLSTSRRLARTPWVSHPKKVRRIVGLVTPARRAADQSGQGYWEEGAP